jgi:hypothetical protein
MAVDISAFICLLFYSPEPPSGLVFPPKAHVASGCYHVHSATGINVKRMNDQMI